MRQTSSGPRHSSAQAWQRSLCAAAVAAAMPALAVDLNPGGDWQVRWDNTVKYSLGTRVTSQDRGALSANTDDGDLSFKKNGLISNRLDILSEFDVQKDGMGLRLSAAGWYDRVYNQSNDFDTPLTANRVPANEFSPRTRTVAGRKLELLDWFVFGKADLGEGRMLSARLGQHSLIWGTSLFFGGNGIAKGMAPIDVYKLSLPGTQAKETTIPVPQLSSTLQLTADTSLEAYVQFKYRPTRLHPAGSYLSTTDMLGDGAQRMFIGNASANRCGATTVPIAQRFNNCYLEYTGLDEGERKNNFGLALNTRSELIDADLGFYAIRYRDTSTILSTNTAGGIYKFVVPDEPINAVGFSVAKLVGETNVGLEVSVRDHQPLGVKEGAISPADPGYARGRTAHLNLSWTTLLPKAGFWEGASIAGEFAANNVLSIENVNTTVAGRYAVGTEKVNRDRNRTSAGFRVVFTPTWYQVAPGLDLSAPVNLGWSLRGVSMVDNSFPFGGSPDRAGELALGLTGVYLNKWNANLTYVNYIGKTARQPLADRDYVRLSLQATF